MQIAGHNLQKEVVDVNNLWKWPMKYSTTKQGSVDVSFVPEVMTWQARASWYVLGPERHIEFEVLPQTLGGLWFCGKPFGEWATFTDIVIREGVL